ncbi:MAG: LptF/LptG family permease, partial [Planctomycetota bacterium]
SELGFVQSALSYYKVQLPLIFLRFGAFVTLGGAMFAAARLQSNNELTPMKSAGVSVRRALAPIFVGTLLLGGAEVVLTEWVIPALAPAIRASGILSRAKGRPGFLRDGRGGTLFVGDYDAAAERLRWLTYRERDDTGRLSRVVIADRAQFEAGQLEGSGAWRAVHGWIRTPGRGSAATETPIPKAGVLLPTAILPIDVESLSESMSLLTFAQLKRQSYERQSYLSSLRVQLYQRFSTPLSHLLLVLLGLPFVLRADGKKSLFLGVLALIVICSLYFLFGFFFTALGEGGSIPAWLAAAGPPILFGATAAWLWRGVPT